MESKFDEQELREKGAKKAVLDYIASQDKSIPLPPTANMEDRGGIILRSDHWREFDSFYGIFESVPLHAPFKSDGGIGREYSSVIPDLETAKKLILMENVGNDEDLSWDLKRRKKLFDYYCNARNLSPEKVLEEIRFFPQVYIKSESAGTVFEHPNVRDRYFFFSGPKNFRPTCSLIFDFSSDKFSPVGAFVGTEEVSPDYFFEKENGAEQGEVERIASLYKKITKMEKFQDGFSYMMEFSLNPDYVFQLRRFKEFEEKPASKCSFEDDPSTLKADFVLGITKDEGVTLPMITGKYGLGIYPFPDIYTQPMHDFNASNPEGFALTDAYGSYLTTFLPNLKTVFGIDPAKTANHGGFETLSTVPLFMFNMKRQLRSQGFGSIHDYQTGMVQVFSDGRKGLVKLLNFETHPYNPREED